MQLTSTRLSCTLLQLLSDLLNTNIYQNSIWFLSECKDPFTICYIVKTCPAPNLLTQYTGKVAKISAAVRFAERSRHPAFFWIADYSPIWDATWLSIKESTAPTELPPDSLSKSQLLPLSCHLTLYRRVKCSYWATTWLSIEESTAPTTTIVETR